MSEVASYDDHQFNAVRVVCAKCRKPYDMTVPYPICGTCRGGKPAPKPSLVDLNGNLMTDP